MSDTRVFLGGLDRQKERMRGIQHMVRVYRCGRASYQHPHLTHKKPRTLKYQILTGCGTSLHAAMYAAKLMRDFEAFRTVMVRVRGWGGLR